MARPNIVFILADDLGYGDFSAFNGGVSSTPTLDALMREGVCLTQHYTASPVCNPSRACLHTGRYPHRTGSIDTLEWWGLERLALRERTLADRLKAAGYATGLVGKWHLGAGVARVLDALRRSGVQDNTIVLFCSDNGPQFGGKDEDKLDRWFEDVERDRQSIEEN
jgi:arylsulfatase A-like enzyme